MLIKYFYLFLFLIFIISIVYGAVSLFIDRKNTRLIKDFETYISVLEYYKSKAYDIIHKDRILIYSLEATKVTDEEYIKVSKEFVRLVEKLLGPRLIKQYLYLYGNYETFSFNLLEYFNTKYDTDEIRKSAMDDLQEKDIEDNNNGT